MTTHLDGRAPHREIAALFDEAMRCKTVEKKKQLRQSVPHLARVFTSLVAEFRASVPAFERKRGIRISGVHRDVKVWKPVEEAFSENGWSCDKYRYSSYFDDHCLELTLDQWINMPVNHYDDRPSAIVSVLQRGGTNVVREMIDNGFDLRKFNRLPCHTGGGLHVIPEIGPMYLWLNQLLLCLRDDERVGAEYFDYYHNHFTGSKSTSEGVRRSNAAKALREALHACDNRAFRDFPKWSTLRSKIASAEGVTRTELLEFTKDLFQLMYRTSHVCLYNELRHKKRSSNIEFDMEDPTMPDALMFQLEVEVTDSLLVALNRMMGLGTDFFLCIDLWDSNGAIFTKRLLKWSARLWITFNLDMVRAVVRKNKNLREIEFEIDNSRHHRAGDECQLWKLLHDLVSCFVECTNLAKFSLHISVLPIARYDVQTAKIKKILEQRNVQVELSCDSRMLLTDNSVLL